MTQRGWRITNSMQKPIMFEGVEIKPGATVVVDVVMAEKIDAEGTVYHEREVRFVKSPERETLLDSDEATYNELFAAAHLSPSLEALDRYAAFEGFRRIYPPITGTVRSEDQPKTRSKK